MKTHPILNTLLGTLGEEGTQRFLSFALPQIRQSRQELLASLRQQDWETAATIAHRLKATAHLYSTNALQDSLKTIHNKELTTLLHPPFLPNLEAEFQYIEQIITNYLNNN